MREGIGVPSLCSGVVIPCYNRRTLLLETLEHVIGQNRLPGRLVVADDGSDDGTADAAESFLRSRDTGFEWEVLRLPRSGHCEARNAGFARVRQLPLVAFLDSDDHWPDDFLARTSDALLASPEAVAASAPRAYRIDGPGRDAQHPGGAALAEKPVEWLFKHGGGIASCTLLRTDAFLQTRRWDGTLRSMADTQLFCEIAGLGRWLHCPGEPVRFHLGNAPVRGEAANLSISQGTHFKWARSAETIYHRLEPGLPETTRKRVGRLIAHRWYRASRQFARKGEPARARTCLRRSLAWNPRSLRIWRKFLFSPRTAHPPERRGHALPIDHPSNNR